MTTDVMTQASALAFLMHDMFDALVLVNAVRRLHDDGGDAHRLLDIAAERLMKALSRADEFPLQAGTGQAQ